MKVYTTSRPRKLTRATLCASVVQADVQSQNIVGFQQITIKQGEWALFTPTFKGISKDFTLGDITVCNANGVEFDDTTTGSGQCRNGVVKVYLMDTGSGSLGGQMGYKSNGYRDRFDRAKETWGWGANKGEAILPGKGLVVYNGHTTDVKFQVSGDVDLQPSRNVPQGTWGIVGNNTPVDRKLGDYTVCNATGVEFDDTTTGSGQCRNGVVKVYKMDPEGGSLGGQMGYKSNGYRDRFDRAKETWGWGANKNVDVGAGEALVIYNGHTTDVILKLTGPLEASKVTE